MPECSRLGIHQRLASEAMARGSKSFAFAARFFPAEVARAAQAVYWFCRVTDDLVDEAEGPQSAAAALDAWEAGLRDSLAGVPVSNPVLGLFAQVAARYQIPPEYPLDLIAGCRMDLTQSRYRDFDELRLYCYRVAATVGLMMMHVTGFSGSPHRHAVDLGVAMQITNIVRDVGEDWRRGRVYLPQADMDACGYSEAELAAGVRNEAWNRLMRLQTARARALYRSGLQGLPSLHPRGRFAVEIAARVYARLLPRIEASGFDVFHHRAYVPPVEKYWIMVRTLCSNAVSATLPSPH